MYGGVEVVPLVARLSFLFSPPTMTQLPDSQRCESSTFFSFWSWVLRKTRRRSTHRVGPIGDGLKNVVSNHDGEEVEVYVP